MRLLIPLFSPATGTWGSLTRVLAVAGAAEARGHEVAFTASGVLAEALQNKGHRVYPCPSSTMFGLPKAISDLLVKRSQRTTPPVGAGRSFGNIWLVFALGGTASYEYLRKLVEAELIAIADFVPDALFTELEPAGLICARLTGLPIATTYASVMAEGVGSLPWKLVNRSVRRLMNAHGIKAMDIDQLCFAPEVLKVVPSIPELEDIEDTRGDVLFVGSLLAPFGDDRSREFPIDPSQNHVFAYLGTGSVSLSTAERVLPEVFPRGRKTRCLVAAQSVVQPYRRGGVEFVSYVPADRVLPHASFMICHGGHNSIIQSISNGVPLIIFPGAIFERRYNARKAVGAGCAVMGELPDFEPEFLRRAIKEQKKLAAATAPLADRIASFGGADAVVDALEKWGGQRPTVLQGKPV